MKKSIKNFMLGIAFVVTVASLAYMPGRNSDYMHPGVFNGLPVEIGIKDEVRYIRISEDWGNRGYKPASLVAYDIDKTKSGFERSGIKMFPAYDLATGKNFEKIKSLEKFKDPVELERIFSYINTDRKQD